MVPAGSETGVVSTQDKTSPSFIEFVVMISMMMSLTALSIDAMLPALPEIGADLGIGDPNDRQLVVSLIFFGLAVGQLFFGPLSDRTGRKTAIYAGYAVYIAGTFIALFATGFSILLVGRILQGVGISSPRAVTMALVRDRYEGRAMARVMSFVMTVFILVPMLAPSLGQALLGLSGWRAIFASYVLIAVVTLLWFGLRMPETLAPENRSPFSTHQFARALREFLTTRRAVGFTVISGLIGGAHLGYLNSSQQIFQEQYALGRLFPLYFAIIALSIGLASLLNARLVLRLGMNLLVRGSLVVMLALALAALGIALLTDGQPPLWLLTIYLMPTFFCVGILFGNMNALAMQPLGHIAGVGAALVGFLATLTSVAVGVLIGQSYSGTVLPLVVGMASVAAVSLLIARWTERE